MEEHHQKGISFRALRGILDEKDRLDIFKQALNFRKQASPQNLQSLEKAVRDYVVVPGFSRNPSRAPTQHLLQFVYRCWENNDKVLRVLLTIWINSQKDLKARAQTFLKNQQEPVIESKGIGKGFVSIWAISGMWNIVTDFCSSHPEFNRTDVAVMFCLLTGKAPLPENLIQALDKVNLEDIEEEANPMDEQTDFEELSDKSTPLRWALWLDELQQLPADAVEWQKDEVMHFVEAVQKLAQSKQAEYEAGLKILDLQTEINTIIQQCQDVLRYFDFAGVSSWKAAMCPAAQVALMKEQVAQLREMLEKHRDLHSEQTDVDNVQEARRLRKDIGSLEDQITEQYRIISEVLQVVDSSSHPEKDNIISPMDGEPVPLVEEPTDEAGDSPESDDLDDTDRTLNGSGIPEEDGSSLQEPDEREKEQSPPIEEPVDETGSAPESNDLDETNRPINGSGTLEEDGSSLLEPDEREKEPSPPPLVEELTDEAGVVSESNDMGVSDYIGDSITNGETLSPLSETDVTEDQLQAQDNTEKQHWHNFLWELIAQDDLPGAYWLVRSLQASGYTSPLPDWLIAAAQGTAWLSHDNIVFTNDLFEISRLYQPENEKAQIMLGLAVAIQSSLLAPETGLTGWLIVPEWCTGFRDVIETLQVFVSRVKRAPRPEELSSVAGVEQLNAAILKASQEARQWLDEAVKKKTTLKRATDVWHQLVDTNGELRNILAPVAEDYRDEVRNVQERLHEWMSPAYVSTQIHRIDQKLAGRGMRPIDGRILERLVRDIASGCTLAKRWCNLVETEQQSRQPDWLSEHIRNLISGMQTHLPVMETALEELVDSNQPGDVSATARCLRRAIVRLRTILNLPDDTSQDQKSGLQETLSEDWLVTGIDSLNQALRCRLFLLPEVELTDEGEPVSTTLPDLASKLYKAYTQQRSLPAVFDAWVQQEDYRFVEQLLSAMRENPEIDAFAQRARDARNESKRTIENFLQKANQELEKAVVDGILIEEERSTPEFSQAVNINTDELLHFKPARERLISLQKTLKQKRTERLDHLVREWTSLHSRLTNLKIIEDQQEAIVRFVTAAIERGDTRVVEESLARLSEVVDTGVEFEEVWFVPSDNRDILKEFKQMANELERSMRKPGKLRDILKYIEEGTSYGSLQFGKLPGGRRKEASRAIDAWTQLKNHSSDSLNVLRINKLLIYLGFETEEKNILVKDKGKDWLYVESLMSASGLSRPIPQFGSLARGRYDIIILWERPGADTIAARLENLRLSMHSVLVIYLGRLTMNQRRDFVGTSIREELSVAILDETLLLFLAQERDARLPNFLQCALPFTAVNPYTPFQAGDVPVEMFFGRQEMAKELQRPTGSCLVYGGRQLGKSALLRHVQREFDNRERKQYAWVEDIKTVGDTKAGQPDTTVIWRRIRDIFQHKFNLIKSRSEKPEEIERVIRQAMDDHPLQRVLILFDEADNFLKADAEKNFHIVAQLRTLMLDTQRRFKVVFAGLQSVQRFQRIPNQPLAHFGTPLRVGPLEPDAAQQLVRMPLEALGYRFADDATVLHILSYTNYHPGLIQIFCDALLKNLHKTKRGLPPYMIEQTDVEKIYRNHEIHNCIRERFNWTLALDTGYEAIVWSLIVDQTQERDSYARAYPPGEILSLVRYWWPQGFSKVDTVKLRSLLEEMYGLGVLVRNNADGYYRLRSPNLVRLMGTDADIQDRLLELADKQPDIRFKADSHHAIIDDTSKPLFYSPMTHEQGSNLNRQRFGVGLVFASKATGLDNLPRAFQHFIPQDSPEAGVFQETSADITDGEQLAHWLDDFVKQYQKQEQLIVHYRMDDEATEQIISLVEQAINFCQHSKRRKLWMRVIFSFTPQATWRWLSLDPGVREELETRSDAVEYPRRWDSIGIRQWLEQHDKMDTQEVCDAILEATGGWICLMNHVFERTARYDNNPRPAADTLVEEMADENSHLRKEFIGALGLEVDEAVYRILKVIRDFGEQEIPQEIITADLFDGSPILSQSICDATLEYLRRMNCIEFNGDMVSIERVVSRVLE